MRTQTASYNAPLPSKRRGHFAQVVAVMSALLWLGASTVHLSPAVADGPPTPQLRTLYNAESLDIVATSALSSLELFDLIQAQTTTLTFQPPLSYAQRAANNAAPEFITLHPSLPADIYTGPWISPPPDEPRVSSWAHTITSPDGDTFHTDIVFHAEGDLLLIAPNADGPISITIQDLSDGDDSQNVTSGQRLTETLDFTIFLITDIDNDTLSLQSTVPIQIQNIHSIEDDPGWIFNPTSILPSQAPSPLLTSSIFPSAQNLFILSPSNTPATLNLIDLSDNDDTQSVTLLPSTIFTTMPLDTPVVWREDLTVFTSLTPLDRDIISLQSTSPVLALTGAFEPAVGRASAAQSSPIGPQLHAALLYAPVGALHLFSPRATPINISALASPPPLTPNANFPSTQWSNRGELFVLSHTVSQPTLFSITSQAPFNVFSSPTDPTLCCAPQPPLSLAISPTLPPYAFAGPSQNACPGQEILLSSNASFDPDLQGLNPSITAVSWDLNIDVDTDADGQHDNDVDSNQPVQLHAVATPGRTRVKLTVTDNDNQRDTHIISLTIRDPQDVLCGGDPDGDGFGSFQDNCPSIPNSDQSDLDNDNQGDLCDPDIDSDGIPNTLDNCPFVPNPIQTDIDSDGQGNDCDLDIDGDGFLNTSDNCPFVPNTLQSDIDNDLLGDACDPDIDNDTIPNTLDNCPSVPNTDQSDLDADTSGDLCDPDIDNDSVPNTLDNCPSVSNTDQIDSDSNGTGNACEDDLDFDGIRDEVDNCPSLFNANQSDVDGDLIGDVCDPDIDNDGVPNALDNCPSVSNPEQVDVDNNNQGDLCQDDSDLDGIPDTADNCPDLPNALQENLDNDAFGDVCDLDMDGDGLSNIQEQTLSTDPRNADTDGDSLRDDLELQIGTRPLALDSDDDGLTDGEEYRWKTDPLNPDSDSDSITDFAEVDWNRDSDADGLINALDPDSDNGGQPDGVEAVNTTNPLDPTDDNPAPPPTEDQTSCSVAPRSAESPSLSWLLLLLLAPLQRSLFAARTKKRSTRMRRASSNPKNQTS